jgi:hypothetical protein
MSDPTTPTAATTLLPPLTNPSNQEALRSGPPQEANGDGGKARRRRGSHGGEAQRSGGVGSTSQVRWAGTENRRIDPCDWPA